VPLYEDTELAVYSSDGRTLVFSTALLQPKTSKNTQGVSVMSLKKNKVVTEARPLAMTGITNVSRYRVRSVPAAGALLKEDDSDDKQLSLLE